MAGLPKTALSRAAEIIRDELDKEFVAVTPRLNVLIGTPNAASARARGAGSAEHQLNLFFYRMSQSGFHAATGPGDELLLRLHCLITPFAAKVDDELNPDLEILGAVVRYFHSQRLLATRVNDDVERGYRIESTLLHPNMEEMNHIWTTQGSDNTDYRLSAVYEFSLVPISPKERRIPAPLVSSAVLDVQHSMEPYTIPPNDRVETAEEKEKRKHTLVWGEDRPRPSGVLPVLMLKDGKMLTNQMTVPRDTAQLPLVLAGELNKPAAIDLVFDDADGKEVGRVRQLKDVLSAKLDDQNAGVVVDVAWPAAARRVRIFAHPVTDAGPQPAHGNTVIASRMP